MTRQIKQDGTGVAVYPTGSRFQRLLTHFRDLRRRAHPRQHMCSPLGARQRLPSPSRGDMGSNSDNAAGLAPSAHHLVSRPPAQPTEHSQTRRGLA